MSLLERFEDCADTLRELLEGAAPPDSGQTDSPPPGEGIRVRFVDDSPTARSFICRLLRGNGFQVETTYSPAIVAESISQDPVRMLPRHSSSLPTATRPENIALRLPATVISSTGYWICPSSTQKPAAPRE